MATRLNPYINFPGTARQALEFYHDVLGGELRLSTFGEFGQPDPAIKDQVMHGMLEAAGGLTLMAADCPPGMPYQAGNNVSVSLSGEDGDALRRCWQRLSEGGQVSVPLERQMWGDEFGACVDKFGIGWLVNINSEG